MFPRSRRTDVGTAPYWFTAALDVKPEHCDVEVDGCRIHLRAWGDTALSPLVLVHGGGAHSGWWDHIAPFLSRTHRVTAPDLSGHGDSDCRASYHLYTWALEVVTVPSATGASGQPTIVGHSMGGWVTVAAATHYGTQIDSIVVIDSPLRDRAPEAQRLRNHRHRGYRTRDEIVARFTAGSAICAAKPVWCHSRWPTGSAPSCNCGVRSSNSPKPAITPCWTSHCP